MDVKVISSEIVMRLNTHANLLSIFSFIIGGLQMLLSLLIGIYALFAGLGTFAALFDRKAGNDGEAYIFGIVAAIFAIFTILGFIVSVVNLYMGFRLRKPKAVGKALLVVASGLNSLNLLWGGLLPCAMGIYGLWFAFSNEGRTYFAGNVYQLEPVYNFPPQNAPQGFDDQQQWHQKQPYRWQ